MPKIECVAYFKDGSNRKWEFLDPSTPYLGGIDKDPGLDQVARYFLQDGELVVCGVDVENRIFVINGVIVKTDLPEGDYKFIGFNQWQIDNTGERRDWYVFGLHATINGKNYKRVVSLRPDNTYEFGLDK